MCFKFKGMTKAQLRNLLDREVDTNGPVISKYMDFFQIETFIIKVWTL